MRIVDLFSGIGAFHLAAKRVDPTTDCVLASDICPRARAAYEKNFGVRPEKDVRDLERLPEHDVLCAGFPCQSFSVMGSERGLEDATRGTLIWETLRLADTARPPCIVLENVRRLSTLHNGAVLKMILGALEAIGYTARSNILSAMDYGLPQRRHRLFIVAFRDRELAERFEWPATVGRMASLEDLLESDVDDKYFASEHVRTLTYQRRGPKAVDPRNRVWITDKGNRVSHRPYALTLRSDPSYNSMLVDGQRRFTEREMLRLQGFPEKFDIDDFSYTAARALIGNSVPVPILTGIFKSIVCALSGV